MYIYIYTHIQQITHNLNYDCAIGENSVWDSIEYTNNKYKNDWSIDRSFLQLISISSLSYKGPGSICITISYFITHNSYCFFFVSSYLYVPYGLNVVTNSKYAFRHHPCVDKKNHIPLRSDIFVYFVVFDSSSSLCLCLCLCLMRWFFVLDFISPIDVVVVVVVLVLN